MTTTQSSADASLSAIAIHVIGQYNDAGKTLVSAYRSGAHRLLDGAASRYGQLLGKRRLPLVGEDLKTRLIGAQEKVSGFLARRLDADTGRVVSVMDRVATGATSGIASVANVAARVESPLGASVLNTLGSLHMPIAKVSMQIADRMAAGARQIETRVAGTTTVAGKVKTVRAKAKPMARRAAPSTRGARKA